VTKRLSTIIDASSIAGYLHGHNDNFMHTSPSHFGRNFTKDQIDNQFRQAFSDLPDSKLPKESKYLRYALTTCSAVLTPYLLFDEVFVDEAALNTVIHFNYGDRSQKYQDIAFLFDTKSFFTEHGDEIGQSISSYNKLLQENSRNSIFNDRIPLTSRLDTSMDLMLKDKIYRGYSSYAATSNNGAYRALFYYMLSQRTGFPICMHPHKTAALNQMHIQLRDDMTELFQHLTTQVLSNFEQNTLDLKIPPLSFLVIDKAFAEDISLIESAQQLKVSNEIASLSQLLMSLKAQQSAGRMHLNTAINREAKEIADALVAKSRYKSSVLTSNTLNIGELPVIGTFLKIINKTSVDIPDYEFFKNPCVSIFNKWANDCPV
jgi:hypothetical protein